MSEVVEKSTWVDAMTGEPVGSSLTAVGAPARGTPAGDAMWADIERRQAERAEQDAEESRGWFGELVDLDPEGFWP